MSELIYPEPLLCDGVVHLRPWRLDDLPFKLEAFTDPLLMRFSVPTRAGVTKAGLLSSFQAQEHARTLGEELNLAFAEPGDDTAILGGGSLYDVDLTQRRAAVGYWLASEARGRGVATHATRLMARWAFESLHIERLELTCGPDNKASQRVAGRLGFTREGLLRSHVVFKDSRRDTVMFSLLPGELQ